MVKIIRDQGPKFQLGFGATSDSINYSEGTQEGPNPESGAISKALHHHPVMRFFATAAVTMVGMHVGGKMLREGGLKLGMMAQETHKPWVTNLISNVRTTQKQLDMWQGVKRTFVDGADDYATSSKLFVRDVDTGRIATDNISERSGFWFTRAEVEAGRAGTEGPTEWTVKEQIQQSLVRSARRMPYELPAAYMVQRGLTDQLFGSEDEFQGKWYNPVDVVTDFVNTSVRNVATMVAPFEVAGAAASQTYKRMMTLGDDFTNMAPRQVKMAKGSIVLQDVLGRVGHDAVNVLHKGVKVSSQTTGAMAAGLNEARERSYSFSKYLYDSRHGNKQIALGTETSTVQRVLKKFNITKDILDLGPGPLSGARSGVQAAGKAFRDIGSGHEAFEELMRLGKQGFDDSLAGNPNRSSWTTALNKRLESSGTPIEELAKQINLLGGGGPGSPAFINSTFFRGQTQNEYSKLIHRQMLRAGMSKKAAQDFSQMINVSAPAVRGEATHLTNRVKFGDADIHASTKNDLFNELYRRVGSSSGVGADDMKVLKGNLENVISTADNIFGTAGFQKNLNRKIKGQWKFVEDTVIPNAAGSLLHKTKPAYSGFLGKLDPAHETYLKRKTAELTGFRVTDAKGKAVNTADIDDHLRKMHFDPDNSLHEMRAFLTTKGAISQPWAKDGLNIFGMRKLSVNEALNKGYFRGGEHNEDQVARLVGKMRANDPMPLGDYALGGVYTSGSGRVVDFNQMKNGLSKFMGKVSAETQIPLIHMSPLEILGYSGKQDLAERSILQYVPGMSNQAFLGRAFGKDDFHIWTKHAGKGSKGKVSSFGINTEGYITQHEAQGWFKPLAAKAGNIATRHAKIAVGNMGHGRAPVREIDKNSWLYKRLGPDRYSRNRDRLDKTRNLLRFDDDQPDSIFRLASRFRRRKTDLHNPTVMAALLRDGKSGDLHLAGSQVYDTSGKLIYDTPEVADAFGRFSSKLRGNGFAPTIMDHVGKGDTRLKKLFDFNLGGAKANTIEAKNGSINVANLGSTGQVLEAGNIIARNDEQLLSKLGPEKAEALRRAQRSLLWRHINESGSTRYWERGLPGSATSGSIHTRIDQFKTDIMKYMMIRSSVMSQTEYAGAIPDMLQELTKLKNTGQISQAQLTEARSALLSTQINVQSFLGYNRTMSSLTNADNLITGARASKNTREALTDIIEGRTSNGSRFSRMNQPLRKRFSTGDYESPGANFNPFGPTNTVFRPTFGTTYNRDPKGALASVAGWNSWNNPTSFSGASVPMGHMVERLNRYAGTFGAGLDPTQFSGPLDLYARGMVGMRALPIVAAGSAALAADRTIGGYTQPKDANGERVYSPFFLGMAARGAAEVQAAGALTPGGQTYAEKREEIFEGETAIRAGRWWPLGNTPFKGGRIQYYRPSWYRRLMAGHLYTDQTYGSPMEHLAFGQDFSPLRPLDPYRFERQHYADRPYPQSGDYFTGPWGPLNPILNATIGRVLKPRITMHKDELAAGLAGYQGVGEYGAMMPSGIMTSGFNTPPGGGYGVAGQGGPAGGGGIAAGQNAAYASAGQYSLGTASNIVQSDIRAVNDTYAAAAGAGPSGAYGVNPMSYGQTNIMRPRILQAGEPVSTGSLGYQAGELGYRAQELFGIYGFAFASGREALGFGNKDLTPDDPVLASASRAYGGSRAFWDLNIGGIGDFPLPIEGNYANLELSEIVRRFIPKERSSAQTVNPIPNMMSLEQPWLPGSDYYINFKQGDPYTAIQEGEMRLPGSGYERFNTLNSDENGKYGLIDQHKILGDVAPWSTEYRKINSLVNSLNMTPEQMSRVETTRMQVEAKSVKNEFTPYEYKYSSPLDTLKSPLGHAIGRGAEWFAHRDSYFNTKFLPERTAVEDWERENVYGSTFPQWEHPIDDFLNPIAYKATQRHPIAATLMTGAMGSLFGRTGRAKTVGSVIGGAVGLGASIYGRTYEMVTGDRYMPAERRKQIALEEYTDILTYTKNMRLASQAKATGDMETSTRFMQQARQTMYGADVYNGSLSEIAMAVPKRKREHFRAMLSAPEEERDQILSTAGRLERRIFQAAWGRKVEERPELDDYFQEHELPAENWEGWHPNTNMEDIKIKMAQSMGIELSEMGYYPQQIREANLLNPSYPSFSAPTQGNTGAQLRALLASKGITGDVIPVRTPYPGQRVQLNGGIFSEV